MKCLCEQCTVKNCDKKKSLVRRTQGKRNRNAGRYAEQKLQQLFKENNVAINATISSGALKSVAKQVGNQKYKFSGDFYSTEILKGTRLKIECKKRQYKLFKRYYSFCADRKIIQYGKFCVLMDANTFFALIKKSLVPNIFPILQLPDRNITNLHKFFEQDNADIVAMISPNEQGNRYLDFIFAVTENTFKKLLNQKY